MSREKPRNLAASVRQKLFSRAQERREDFGLVLTKYGSERFLYRLSRSEYRDQFVLKGALLFELWTHRPYRPTRDLDLSGQGDSSIARMKKVFGDVIAQVRSRLSTFIRTCRSERKAGETQSLKLPVEVSNKRKRVVAV